MYLLKCKLLHFVKDMGNLPSAGWEAAVTISSCGSPHEWTRNWGLSSLSMTSNGLRKECSKGQLQASPTFIDLNQLNTRQLAAQSRGLPSIFPSTFLKWRLQMVKYLFLFVSSQNVLLSTRSERGSWYFLQKYILSSCSCESSTS